MEVEAKILAMMLALQPPGASAYSRTAVSEGTPPPCGEKYSPLCFAPQWDKRRNAWTITEQADAGLKRYKTISKAIAAETKSATVGRYLVAAFYHESGFREDIHAGIGSAARGDCKWTGKRIGKGKRIPGTCRSVCLGQMLFDPPHRSIRVGGKRYKQSDLVGTDLQSTRRCARVSSTLIRRALKRCSGDHPLCVFGTYGGVRIPSRSKLIRSRAETYYKLKGLKL